jgi:hypothetical protein
MEICKILHILELHNFYTRPDIIKIIKSKMIECMEGMTNMYRILFLLIHRRSQFVGSRRRFCTEYKVKS